MGLVLIQGKMRMSETWNSNSPPFDDEVLTYELFHYHGDPSMKLWTTAPADITASHAGAIMIAQSYFTINNITCDNGFATIYFNNQIIGRGEIIEGAVSIQLDPIPVTTGTALLTITSHNHRPYQTELPVIPSGPAIIPIDPVAGSLFDNGEQIKITWQTFEPESIPDVHIEFSSDGGLTFSDIIASTPNNNSYLWNAASVESDECIMRISAIDGDPFGVTNEFSIHNLSSITGKVNGNLYAEIYYSGPLSGTIFTDSLTGDYRIERLLPGQYELFAKAGDFYSDTFTVTVPPDQNGLDFTIQYPQLVAQPDMIKRTILVGDSILIPMKILNRGDALLEFSVASVDKTSVLVLPAEEIYDEFHFAFVPKGEEDIRIGNPVNEGKGGPDNYGYAWKDSDEPGGPTYIWNDIISTGTLLNAVSNCDDCSQGQNLSFPFLFYGNEFTSIYVSSNGYITFGIASSTYSNHPLPSLSMASNLIAGFYSDLTTSGNGDIYFQDFGDYAIIQFENVPRLSGDGSVTFQIVLKKSGEILIFYNIVIGNLTNATIGIQNGTRDDGLTVAYNTIYLKNNLAVQFRFKPEWLRCSLNEGNVDPGDSLEFSVTCDATELLGGSYFGALDFTHNDPGTINPYSIPCTLIVDGVRRLSVLPVDYNFGNVWTGAKDSTLITLTNAGDEATVVHSITSSIPEFTYNQILPLTILPFESATFKVIFTPSEVGVKSGNLIITSNAEDNPTLNVNLSGTGTPSPQIAVSPNGFHETLDGGDSLKKILTIENPGGDTLNFSIIPVGISFPSNGIIGNWVFNKGFGDTLYDLSINRNNGIIFGATWVEDSFIDGALYFDGVDDYVDLKNRNFSVPISLCIWMKSTTVNSRWSTVFGWNSTVDPENEGIQFSATGDGRMHIRMGNSSQDYITKSRIDGDNQWHCIVFSKDVNDTLSIYTDGKIETKILITSSIGSDHNLYFGKSFRPDNYNEFFNGWIGDIKMYNRILEEEEITALYERNSPTWITSTPGQGDILPGEDSEIDLTFNSQKLISDMYICSLSINHNAPEYSNPLFVPCTLSVNGFKSLVVSPQNYDFGDLWVGLLDTTIITLTNDANEATIVNSITSNNSIFSQNAVLPLSVPPFDSVTFEVIFMPNDVGDESGILTINSNAEDNPILNVNFSGVGISPPEISVSPKNYHETIDGGDSLKRVLTFNNSGGDDLDFEISFQNANEQKDSPISAKVTRSQFVNPHYLTEKSHYSIDGAHSFNSSLILPNNINNTRNDKSILLTTSILVLGNDRDGNGWIKENFSLNIPNIQIDTMDITNLVPELAYLHQFDVVLVYRNVGFNNQNNIGDRLYEYVMEGGNLIIGTFYWQGRVREGWGLLESIDPLYGDACDYNASQLNTQTIVSHPLTENLTTLSVSEFRGGPQTVRSDATVVAWWLDGDPLIAFNQPNGTITMITVYPYHPYYGGVSGDFYLLWENAIKWTSNSIPQWLSAFPLNGKIEPTEQVTSEIVFNASGLVANTYSILMNITHNDPNSINPLVIPCTLTVNGFRSLTVTPSTIDFGNIWAGLHDTLTIILNNEGNDTTIVNSITNDNSVFACNVNLPLVVPAFESVTLEVIFSPIDIGSESGHLTINSNAEDNPILTVDLAGTGTEPPDALLIPTALTFTMGPQSPPADQTSVLTNIGGDILSYRVASCRQVSGPIDNFAIKRIPRIRSDLIYNDKNYENPFIPGRVIVALKNGRDNFNDNSILSSIQTESARELAKAINPVTKKRAYTGRKLLLLKLKTDTKESVIAAIEELRKDENVAYAEPDYEIKLLGVPDDQHFGNLYGMHNTGQTGGTSDADIDAPEAWEKHTGNKKILIGVIDTGIDYLHPDLQDNIWTNPGEIPGNGIDDEGNGYIDDIHGWDFAYDDNDPQDDHDHGTHCAGTIGAVGNNGVGVAGVMWNAEIMAIKVFNSWGGLNAASDALDGIVYANAMGVDIASNSWGVPFSQAMMDAIAIGGLYVFAAGNDYGNNNDINPVYPASYNLDNIIAVAATDHNDGLASFSNYGPTSVDLGAPGVDIYSCRPGSSYQNMSGTSMATPHVAGVAGLVWSYNTSLSVLQVKELLLESVDSIPSLDGKILSNGRVNVNKALDASGPEWLSVSPVDPGTLNPDESQIFTVTVDPNGLIEGQWEGEIIIETNDPDAREIQLNVTANVTGCKSLISDLETLDYNNVWVGTQDSLNVLLINECNDTVTVHSATFTNIVFSSTIALPLKILPFSESEITIYFSPVTTGSQSGIISIHSDAEDNPTLTVDLSGVGVDPPGIVVTPDQFVKYTQSGGIVTDVLTIHNTGGDNLHYEILGSSEAAIVINEFCHEPDFLELWNRGKDQDMTGWTIHIDDNAGSTGTFPFPSGYILKSGKRVVLREYAGTENDSTFYYGTNIGWIDNSIVAIALTDNNGTGVDFVRTVNSSVTPPAGTNWSGGVDFYSISAARNSNEDNDDQTDWVNLSTHTEYFLNPGQDESGIWPNWLQASKTSGVLLPSLSDNIDLTFNAEGLDDGTYSGQLFIVHNAPGVDPFEIQLQFNIGIFQQKISRILYANPSSSIKISGKRYTIEEVIVGGTSGGVVRGKRYRIKLK